MNFKKVSIIFLGLLMLIFAMSAVSASEDMQGDTLKSNITIPDNATDTDDQGIDNKTIPENKTPKNKTPEKIKTKVQADEKAVKYKKSSYYKIKVQDKNNTLLKNVKLKVVVTSDKKVKTFYIKTNSKGIAQFNTNGLKVGKYKVNITSADSNYTISKTSKIFVGKYYSAVVRFSYVKVLKNKDRIKLKVVYDSDKGKEVTIVFKGKAKFTKILKAKFVFYKPKNKKVVTKKEYSKFKNGKWELPDKDYSFKYQIWKAKVYYISYKTKS